jgi:hypothetical protein
VNRSGRQRGASNHCLSRPPGYGCRYLVKIFGRFIGALTRVPGWNFRRSTHCVFNTHHQAKRSKLKRQNDSAREFVASPSRPAFQHRSARRRIKARKYSQPCSQKVLGQRFVVAAVFHVSTLVRQSQITRSCSRACVTPAFKVTVQPRTPPELRRYVVNSVIVALPSSSTVATTVWPVSHTRDRTSCITGS